jgi:hypothetical protein
MTEFMTETAASAIKSRLARSRATLIRLSSPALPGDFELIALATHSVATALDLPASIHAAYNLASISRADALKNLATILSADITGAPVASITDFIQAAREIETAVHRTAS